MNNSSTNLILLKELEIEHICKASLKNSYISVSYSKITLKTPKVSKQYIEKLLLDRESWIRKQLKKLEQKQTKRLILEDEILLFGTIFSVDIDEAEILRAYLEKLKINSDENILKAYDKFYKDYALIYLRPRLEYFAEIMGLKYTELKFRKMKSRWGSCSSKGKITLNTQLIKVKKELIDYVLVHELAHLVHMNHSTRFHSLVEQYLPDSKNIKKELRYLNLTNL